MLYLSGEMSKPRRIQSAFVSETELKKVVQFLVKHNDEDLSGGIELSSSSENEVENGILDATFDGTEEDDELYEEARDIVVRTGKASTSYLQRKLRLGYARAARLMDILEERGVVGPADGSKPREVLLKGDGGGGTGADEREKDEEDEEGRDS